MFVRNRCRAILAMERSAPWRFDWPRQPPACNSWRIPPDAPYHIVNVARYVRGDTFRTDGIISRRLEIEADIDVLQQKQRNALTEYRRAFEDFSDEAAAQNAGSRRRTS